MKLDLSQGVSFKTLFVKFSDNLLLLTYQTPRQEILDVELLLMQLASKIHLPYFLHKQKRRTTNNKIFCALKDWKKHNLINDYDS